MQCRRYHGGKEKCARKGQRVYKEADQKCTRSVHEGHGGYEAEGVPRPIWYMLIPSAITGRGEVPLLHARFVIHASQSFPRERCSGQTRIIYKSIHLFIHLFRTDIQRKFTRGSKQKVRLIPRDRRRSPASSLHLEESRSTNCGKIVKQNIFGKSPSSSRKKRNFPGTLMYLKIIKYQVCNCGKN